MGMRYNNKMTGAWDERDGWLRDYDPDDLKARGLSAEEAFGKDLAAGIFAPAQEIQKPRKLDLDEVMDILGPLFTEQVMRDGCYGIAVCDVIGGYREGTHDGLRDGESSGHLVSRIIIDSWNLSRIMNMGEEGKAILARIRAKEEAP